MIMMALTLMRVALMRDAMTLIGPWTDGAGCVVVQLLTLGQELATVCVVPRAPHAAAPAPALQHLHHCTARCHRAAVNR